jgi:hypothetical protein
MNGVGLFAGLFVLLVISLGIRWCVLCWRSKPARDGLAEMGKALIAARLAADELVSSLEARTQDERVRAERPAVYPAHD